jgi:hypothetical protein
MKLAKNIFSFGILLFLIFSTLHANSNEILLTKLNEDINSSNGIKPPLNAGRITGEILVGSAGGLLGGVFGFIIASPYENMKSYSFGNLNNETGNFGASLIGSAVFEILAFLAYKPHLNTSDEWDFYNNLPKITFLFGFAAPIGATISFNATRRYKTPPTNETGFINIKNGSTFLSFPSVYIERITTEREYVKHHVNLVNISF